MTVGATKLLKCDTSNYFDEYLQLRFGYWLGREEPRREEMYVVLREKAIICDPVIGYAIIPHQVESLAVQEI